MKAVIDTSPIVAILSPNDNYHLQCRDALKQLSPPLLTSWAVVTETHYLLRHYPHALESLFKSFKNGLFQIETITPNALEWFQGYLKKYSDLSPQIADVSLIYIAQKYKIRNVFTLDKRDFSVYRFDNKKSPIIIPD